MKTRIKGGRVVDPASGIDETADVYVDAGCIQGIGRKPRGFAPERTLDARHLMVLPGLVDLSARLREPGAEHKANVYSELWAAAVNGFTAVCLPPDTDPPIDLPAVVELVNHRAARVRGARVLCLGALTEGLVGDRLAEMGALKEIGCVGVSNALRPVADTRVLLRAFQYASNVGLTVHHVPVEAFLSQGAGVHLSATSLRAGLPGEPAIAELIETHRAVCLAREAGARVHLARMSAADTAALLTDAKRRNDRLTADVAIANLIFTEAEIANHSGQFRVHPPLRTVKDRNALARALKKGTIDAVTSDHQPHDIDAKDGAFMSTEAGLSTLDGFLPALCEAGLRHDIPFAALVRAASFLPAKILGTDGGRIHVGGPADLCLFDPGAEYRFDESHITSRGANSPFLGRRMSGRVAGTMVAGDMVYEGTGL